MSFMEETTARFTDPRVGTRLPSTFYFHRTALPISNSPSCPEVIRQSLIRFNRLMLKNFCRLYHCSIGSARRPKLQQLHAGTMLCCLSLTKAVNGKSFLQWLHTFTYYPLPSLSQTKREGAGNYPASLLVSTINLSPHLHPRTSLEHPPMHGPVSPVGRLAVAGLRPHQRWR